MLKYVHISIFVLLIISCKTKTVEDSEAVVTTQGATSDSSMSDAFFPVTSYIRGQINDIRLKGVNPMMYTIVKGRTDSSWLKAENLEMAMAPFLASIIDTSNLQNLFSEKEFLDQTLNAYTFTYDPKTVLPDSLALQHWDVYVDPGTNKVTRIYLIRKNKDNTQQQLTWQSDKWCKIVTIAGDEKENSVVAKEVFIKWDF